MDVNLHYAGIQLDRGRHLTLRAALGTRVLCLAGELWITQDRDPNDHFVQPGETFAVSVDGTVVVQANRGAQLLLLERDAPRREGWLARWLGFARLDRPAPLLARLHGA
jgi:hypothetical protein